jgi:hypothetical protein
MTVGLECVLLPVAVCVWIWLLMENLDKWWKRLDNWGWVVRQSGVDDVGLAVCSALLAIRTHTGRLRRATSLCDRDADLWRGLGRKNAPHSARANRLQGTFCSPPSVGRFSDGITDDLTDSPSTTVALRP